MNSQSDREPSTVSSVQSMRIECRGKTLDLSSGTLIMGVVNVTPDSFSDGGKFLKADVAVEHALRLRDEGADIIDVGGESTRPGSDRISAEEELRRVMPVVENLIDRLDVPISVDTYRADVAEQTLAAGAHMINDISALRFDHRMSEVVARYDVPVVLMHMLGEPKTMQANPNYTDVVGEIMEFFRERVEAAISTGIDREKLIIDPGIGFGKRVRDNYEILRKLSEFRELGLPIMVGPSRKSFIGAVTGLSAEERVEGTSAAVAISVLNGADIVRVHDVREMKQTVLVADAIAEKVPVV